MNMFQMIQQATIITGSYLEMSFSAAAFAEQGHKETALYLAGIKQEQPRVTTHASKQVDKRARLRV